MVKPGNISRRMLIARAAMTAQSLVFYQLATRQQSLLQRPKQITMDPIASFDS